MLAEHISRIHLLIERDKLDIAQQKIAKTLAEFPDSDDLHILQAELYLKKDEYKNALEAAERVIGLNPENEDAYFIQARVYVAREEYKKAHKAIDRALELNPYASAYYAIKAIAYLDTQKHAEAIEYAKKGLEIYPDDLLCNNVLSLAQTKAGHSEEAFERLEYMLAEDPENSLTQANMGYHFLRKGDIKKAKEHFSIALQKDPTNEFTKAGMMQAIKSTNWFYRKFLQYSLWIDKIGRKNKFALYIGVIILVKVLPLLLPFYLLLILWSWFAGPLSDVILYFDRYGRYLMTRENYQLTKVNICILLAAVFCVFLSFMVDSSFFGLAFALGLSIVPIYLIDSSARPGKRIAMGVFASAFIGVGLWGVYISYFMEESGWAAWGVLIFGSVAFSWVASLMK
ncbi:tetratricopeptide (TPR) repeat protein [Catalinimonas alkaloidigena]|uniref:tetratricopeptide repeat protein n=1 Tax=Catalinimonas alkaloidigena TaxID=1075417 RepID=UPI0024070184|nr:tetratricopeptide repeat protein [Catalinimonas alkaloidigena]MDF9794908.1 tetratricopeptide (TPR) repeat protein [Catalinimonas alkaloidigena]